MASLRAQFIRQFPEFKNSDGDQVDAMLDAAALEIDADVWGAKATQGQFYLAAHKLALSPFGNNAELQAGSGVTSYSTHYDALVRQVSSGFRVC